MGKNKATHKATRCFPCGQVSNEGGSVPVADISAWVLLGGILLSDSDVDPVVEEVRKDSV